MLGVLIFPRRLFSEMSPIPRSSASKIITLGFLRDSSEPVQKINDVKPKITEGVDKLAILNERKMDPVVYFSLLTDIAEISSWMENVREKMGLGQTN